MAATSGRRGKKNWEISGNWVSEVTSFVREKEGVARDNVAIAQLRATRTTLTPSPKKRERGFRRPAGFRHAAREPACAASRYEVAMVSIVCRSLSLNSKSSIERSSRICCGDVVPVSGNIPT